ncbi:DUF3021 family protein [Enterococcus termitis]
MCIIYMGIGAIFLLVYYGLTGAIPKRSEIIVTLVASFTSGLLTFILYIEKLKFNYALIFHFFVMYSLWTITSLYNRWVSISSVDFFKHSLIFIGIYVLVWCIIYRIEQAELQRINDFLNQ